MVGSHPVVKGHYVSTTQSHRLAVYNRAFGTTVKQGDACKCEVEQIATPSSCPLQR